MRALACPERTGSVRAAVRAERRHGIRGLEELHLSRLLFLCRPRLQPVCPGSWLLLTGAGRHYRPRVNWRLSLTWCCSISVSTFCKRKLECCQEICVYIKYDGNTNEENGQATTAGEAGSWLRIERAVSCGRSAGDLGRNRQVRHAASGVDSRRPVERGSASVGTLAARRKEDFLFWPAAQSDLVAAPFDGAGSF